MQHSVLVTIWFCVVVLHPHTHNSETPFCGHCQNTSRRRRRSWMGRKAIKTRHFQIIHFHALFTNKQTMTRADKWRRRWWWDSLVNHPQTPPTVCRLTHPLNKRHRYEGWISVNRPNNPLGLATTTTQIDWRLFLQSLVCSPNNRPTQPDMDTDMMVDRRTTAEWMANKSF